MQASTPRHRKLPEPRLQLRLIGEFMGLAVLGLVLQYILLGVRLRQIASRVDASPGELVDAVPQVLTSTLLFTFAILLPILFAFGTRFTLRIVGPIHRFEKFLAAVKKGEQTEPCRLRASDDLQQLCELLNDVTEPLRAGERSTSCEPSAEARRQAG